MKKTKITEVGMVEAEKVTASVAPTYKYPDYYEKYKEYKASTEYKGKTPVVADPHPTPVYSFEGKASTNVMDLVAKSRETALATVTPIVSKLDYQLDCTISRQKFEKGVLDYAHKNPVTNDGVDLDLVGSTLFYMQFYAECEDRRRKEGME